MRNQTTPLRFDSKRYPGIVMVEKLGEDKHYRTVGMITRVRKDVQGVVKTGDRVFLETEPTTNPKFKDTPGNFFRPTYVELKKVIQERYA